jgi:hypothetical protein
MSFPAVTFFKWTFFPKPHASIHASLKVIFKKKHYPDTAFSSEPLATEVAT